MKPAWDQLADEYAGSSSVLVADVDCTADGKELCEKFSVRGYPTIKVFKDGDIAEGEDYRGGRDFDGLKKYVEDNLAAICDVADPKDACSEKEQGYIEKMKVKSKEDIAKQLTRLEGMKGDAMKKELKAWLMQRLNILTQLSEKSDEL